MPYIIGHSSSTVSVKKKKLLLRGKGKLSILQRNREKKMMMIVQFRPYCQVWRLGPLDLTH